MIDVVTRETLKALMGKQDEVCVSIFMPAHRAGGQIQEGPIRLKNLLKQAEEGLAAYGLRTVDIRRRLEPLEPLLVDTLFWKYQGDGLALFLSADDRQVYRLPLALEELVVVNERFHLKPLLPLLTGDGHFYVLALSQNEIRLLEGTRDSVDSVELENMPGSLTEMLRLDDQGRPLQFHTSASAPHTGSRRAAVFHGHGAEVDSKENILRYFRRINQGLREVLREEQVPLVLAGVRYLFPIYQEANSYPYLLAEGIEGNPEELSVQELHRRAWEIVQPHFLKARQEALARYTRMASTDGDRVSDRLEEIVPAAVHGRVEVLFVDPAARRWGAFDVGANALTVRDEVRPGDEDLLDLAAVQTLINGGTVYGAGGKDLPADAPLAAVFRY